MPHLWQRRNDEEVIMGVRRSYRRGALAALVALAIGVPGAANFAAAEPSVGDFEDADNLVTNPTFETSFEGWSAYGVAGEINGGVYCGGYSGPNVNDYDAGVGFDGMVLPAGDYFACFDAKGTGSQVRAVVTSHADPTVVYSDGIETLTADAATYSSLFTIAGDEDPRAAGHVGRPAGPDKNQGDNAVACQPADDSQATMASTW